MGKDKERVRTKKQLEKKRISNFLVMVIKIELGSMKCIPSRSPFFKTKRMY